MDKSLTRIAAAFSFAAPISIFVAFGIALAHGLGGPVTLDFSTTDSLRHMQDAKPAMLWTELLALVGPTLALGAGLGWYRILRPAGSYVALGVLLWYVGMVFVVTQDALEYVLVARLPELYFAANETARAAIAAFGASLGGFIETLGATGDLVSNSGMALVCIAMLGGVRSVPRWLGGLGLASALLISLPLLAEVVVPGGPFGPARGVGFLLFMVWFVATGVVMARWQPPVADAV